MPTGVRFSATQAVSDFNSCAVRSLLLRWAAGTTMEQEFLGDRVSRQIRLFESTEIHDRTIISQSLHEHLSTLCSVCKAFNPGGCSQSISITALRALLVMARVAG